MPSWHWHLPARLPTGRNADGKAARRVLFSRFDPNGNGYLSLAEVDAWVDADDAITTVPGYDFRQLAPGNTIDGPAIVWTPITTLVVGRQQVAHVDGFRNLIVK